MARKKERGQAIANQPEFGIRRGQGGGFSWSLISATLHESLRTLSREENSKQTAFTQLGLEIDRSLVSFDNPFRQMQPQTTARTFVATLSKPLEKLRLVFWGYTGSGVLNFNHQPRGIALACLGAIAQTHFH